MLLLVAHTKDSLPCSGGTLFHLLLRAKMLIVYTVGLKMLEVLSKIVVYHKKEQTWSFGKEVAFF